MARPLSALRGWNSTTILPVIRRNTEADFAMERLDNGADFRLSLRRRAVMKRKRPAFVFEHEAGSIRCERRKLWPQAIECRRAGAVDHAIENSVGAPSFEPVQTCCGASPGLEQLVELGERAAADQGKRSLALRPKAERSATASRLVLEQVPDGERSRAASRRHRGTAPIADRAAAPDDSASRQRGVFVRCTFLRRGMCAKCLI